MIGEEVDWERTCKSLRKARELDDKKLAAAELREKAIKLFCLAIDRTPDEQAMGRVIIDIIDNKKEASE